MGTELEHDKFDVMVRVCLNVIPERDGASGEFRIACKLNLFVMPGMPRSWHVCDTKRWRMIATCCGDLSLCSIACQTSLLELAKARPFVYVTRNGEPPEIDAPPFLDMPCVGFIADCRPEVLCDMCKLPGVRAIEIRKQRPGPPPGYRVRIFHDSPTPPDLAQHIDPAALYDIAQAKQKKPKKAKKGRKDGVEVYRVAAEVAAKSEQYIQDCTAEVAQKLDEANTEILERVVRYAGMSLVNKTIESTLELEENGGMLTWDGSRRRQPGGVFLQLLQNSLTPEQHALIFEQASPNLMAQSPMGLSPPGAMFIGTSAASFPSSSGSALSTANMSASLGSSFKQQSGSVLSVNACEFVPSSSRSKMAMSTEDANTESCSQADPETSTTVPQEDEDVDQFLMD